MQLMDEGSLIYDDSGTRVVSVSIPDYGDQRGGERPKSLADVAKYANAIGPWKRQILRDVGQPKLLTTSVIEQAHQAGLRVHTYTFRNEPATLAPGVQQRSAAGIPALLRAGHRRRVFRLLGHCAQGAGGVGVALIVGQSRTQQQT